MVQYKVSLEIFIIYPIILLLFSEEVIFLLV